MKVFGHLDDEFARGVLLRRGDGRTPGAKPLGDRSRSGRVEVEVDVMVARVDVARVDVLVARVDGLVARVDKVLVMVIEGDVPVTVMVGVTTINVELIGWGSGADAAFAPSSKPRQVRLANVKSS